MAKYKVWARIKNVYDKKDMLKWMSQFNHTQLKNDDTYTGDFAPNKICFINTDKEVKDIWSISTPRCVVLIIDYQELIDIEENPKTTVNNKRRRKNVSA